MKLLSRQDALSQKTMRYFTGKPCKRGHIAERQLSNGSCVECRNEDRRDFHKRNPERSLFWVHDWAKRNREYSLAYRKEYRQKNHVQIIALCRNRKARKKGNGGTHTAIDIQDLLRLQKGKCAYCRVNVSKKYHVDHIIPIAKGGRNDRANLQILCEPCNRRKHSKDPIEFAQSLGRLL